MRIAANMTTIYVLSPGGHAGGWEHMLLARQHRRRPYGGSMLDCTPFGELMIEGAGNQNLTPLTTLKPPPSRVQGLRVRTLDNAGYLGVRADTALSLSPPLYPSLSLSVSLALSLARSLVRIARGTRGHGGVRDDGP